MIVVIKIPGSDTICGCETELPVTLATCVTCYLVDVGVEKESWLL